VDEGRQPPDHNDLPVIIIW